MQQPAWAPDDVAVMTPSPARMYDALLGGSHNFQVDRAAAAQAIALVPDLPLVARSNRAFLRRAVRFMVDAGIRQFVDLGAGIPTVGNTHEVAQQADPACRVAYVDIDPVAVAHAHAILDGNPNAIAVRGDLRSPRRLLDAVPLCDFLDLDQPLGVLLVAVLHLLTDAERPGTVVATLRDAVAPGSYLAVSHLTGENRPEDAARLGAHAADRSRVPIIFRSQEEVSRFFTGFRLVEPGVVELPLWRPESVDDIAEPPGRSLGLAGVALKD